MTDKDTIAALARENLTIRRAIGEVGHTWDGDYGPNEPMRCGSRCPVCAIKSIPLSLHAQIAEKERRVWSKVSETMTHYEKQLADAKVSRDKRLYELNEVAYLAQLRADLEALKEAAK